MFNNSKIKDVKIHRTLDNENCYQLVVIYNNVDELGNVDEIEVKTLLNFADRPYVVFDTNHHMYKIDITRIDFGFGDIWFDYKIEKSVEITSKRILTNCKEMTIEEIQKELGYKVKIVGERKEFSCPDFEKTIVVRKEIKK